MQEHQRYCHSEETLLVTDRDEVVAELRPARRRKKRGGRLEKQLERMAERGELTRPTYPGKFNWSLKPLSGGPLPSRSAEILDEPRGARG